MAGSSGTPPQQPPQQQPPHPVARELWQQQEAQYQAHYLNPQAAPYQPGRAEHSGTNGGGTGNANPVHSNQAR